MTLGALRRWKRLHARAERKVGADSFVAPDPASGIARAGFVGEAAEVRHENVAIERNLKRVRVGDDAAIARRADLGQRRGISTIGVRGGKTGRAEFDHLQIFHAPRRWTR